jgi:hypothetical protein
VLGGIGKKIDFEKTLGCFLFLVNKNCNKFPIIGETGRSN